MMITLHPTHALVTVSTMKPRDTLRSCEVGLDFAQVKAQLEGLFLDEKTLKGVQSWMEHPNRRPGHWRSVEDDDGDAVACVVLL